MNFSEKIEKADDRTIQKLLREMDFEILVILLSFYFSNAAREKIFESVSHRVFTMLNQEIARNLSVIEKYESLLDDYLENSSQMLE